MPSKMDILMKVEGSPIAKGIRLGMAFLCFVITANLVKRQMISIQARPGQLLNDPVLNMFGPWDLNLPIFLLTYIPIVLGIILVIRDNTRTIRLIYSYCLLQVFRLSCIFLVPLEPPAKMIVLNDPISDHLVFETVVTKDLFFSGHVSTLVLFSFYFKSRKVRWLYRGLALVDALCLMGQHVHYFIDVLAAPFFACLCFALIRYASHLNLSFFKKFRTIL